MCVCVCVFLSMCVLVYEDVRESEGILRCCVSVSE